MKSMLLLALMIATSAFAEMPVPGDFRYHAHFTKYSCKSFRDEAAAPSVFTEKDITFKNLDVDHNMKNAVLTLVSTTDVACKYMVHYAIDGKADTLTYVESSIEGDETCAAKKYDMDAVFKEGFKYVQKYYYYFALKFNSKFSNSCETTTNNIMAEFELGKE